MIRHFVFFTAKSSENIEPIQQGLSILTEIPHAQTLEIAINRKSDPLSSEVDIVVYGEFRDDAALAAYKAHELYAEAIRLVRPLREMRLAADYQVSAAVTRPFDRSSGRTG
ncbi:Dabb family protein [Bosea sp. F3-2]|uniref:Dabb family protein n=1 Tax=Bosea sp. F3-2 TaxID=2599640 RepID=UPI0011EC61A6|nr:Dabb family protein [Bosea sp. F3-2]QEL25151.1 Dabb family protein [Bosea sp. F3-2]